VDRSDRVVAKGTDQWVQEERSVRLVALWLCGRRAEDLEVGWEVSRCWDPQMEANPFSRAEHENSKASLMELHAEVEAMKKSQADDEAKHSETITSFARLKHESYRASFAELEAEVQALKKSQADDEAKHAREMMAYHAGLEVVNRIPTGSRNDDLTGVNPRPEEQSLDYSGETCVAPNDEYLLENVVDPILSTADNVLGSVAAQAEERLRPLRERDDYQEVSHAVCKALKSEIISNIVAKQQEKWNSCDQALVERLINLLRKALQTALDIKFANVLAECGRPPD